MSLVVPVSYNAVTFCLPSKQTLVLTESVASSLPAAVSSVGDVTCVPDAHLSFAGCIVGAPDAAEFCAQMLHETRGDGKERANTLWVSPLPTHGPHGPFGLHLTKVRG